MSEPVTVHNGVLPVVIQWSATLLSAASLVDTTVVRIWMVVIGASVTLGVTMRFLLGLGPGRTWT